MSYTFLLEQGEESSAECYSDIPLCVLSKSSPTAEKRCYNDNATESCPDSRYGMTSQPLMEDHGADKSMSLLEDSLARTSALPEKAKGSAGSDLDSGEKWQELSAKYDLNTHSWKTHQHLWVEDLPECSVTLPRWGMMLNGVCWALATPERRIKGSVYGYWPTPTAQDAKNNGAPSQMARNTKPLNAEVGGKLNPMWVEWLMGWPIGWTGLEPLETDRFRQWLRLHGVL